MARVTPTKLASPAELARLAGEVWAEVLKAGVAADDVAGCRQLLSDMQRRHADFAASFPIVLRWMVEAREYRKKAFTRYLKFFAAAPRGDQEAQRAVHAEYLVCLFREKFPRAPTNAIKSYRDSIVARLRAEDEEFERIAQEAEDHLTAKATQAREERRRELYLLLMQMKLQRAALPPPDADGAAEGGSSASS